MTGLDANVLIRYLVQDDPNQAAKATRAIERGAARDEAFFICDIVLCELVWVLETAYKYRRPAVATALEHILQTRQFRFVDKALLWLAVADYRQQKGDFADYLIGRTGHRAGEGQTLTFDKALRHDPYFNLL